MKQSNLLTFILISIAVSVMATINIAAAANGENEAGSKNIPTGKGAVDGKSATDAKGTVEGKGIADAKGAIDGKGTVEGKDTADAKGTVEGKGTADAKGATDGKGTVDGKSATDGKGSAGGKADNTIGFIGLGLGILNSLGLGTLFLLNKKALNKIQEKARNSEQRIDSLKSKHQLLDTHVKKIDGDIQNSSGKTNKEIERLKLSVEDISRKAVSIQQSASIPQSNHRAERYPSPSERYNPTSVSTQLSPTDYYNNYQHDFQNKYQITAVGRETENFNKSRAAQTDLVILAGDQQGNYWLFSDSSELCIVPKQNLKITGSRINNTKDLFECQHYNEQNYDNFTLVKPAVVVSQGDGTWKLTRKGELEFG